MSFLTGIKDNVVSFSTETILKFSLKRYGEMLDFSINSEDKTISVRILLKGEPEPLLVKINKYEFIEDHGSPYIIIKNINVSKEWMNVAAKDFLVGKKLHIPEKFAGIIKMLL